MNIQCASFLVGVGCLALGCGDSGGVGGQPIAGNGNGGEGGQAPIAGTGGEGGDPSLGGANAGGAELGGASGDGGAPLAPDVVWSNVVITDGCFLFSDPTQLGDQVTWGEGSDPMTLVFDLAERSYTGTPEGAALVLQGDHESEFDGDVWKYQEIFDGVAQDGVFTGSWSYGECNFTVDPEGCPTGGGCFGSADFVITMPARVDR